MTWLDIFAMIVAAFITYYLFWNNDNNNCI